MAQSSTHCCRFIRNLKMAKFVEEETKTEEVVNEPSSDTQIYTMKSQIGHERTASERLADRVRRS